MAKRDKNLITELYFLPTNKKHQRKVERNLKKLSRKSKNPNNLLVRTRIRVKKKHKVLKAISLILVGGVGGFLLYNYIVALIYNSDKKQTVDPLTAENVIDKGGHDVEFDENGQIVMDTLSEEERTVLKESFSSLLLDDAVQSSGEEIAGVSKLLAFSLMPYNLVAETNEFDKNMLSVVFEDDKNQIYSLNYLTGENFELKAEYDKDVVIDFIKYLQYNCAIYSCDNITNNRELFDTALDESVSYVGNPYWGFKESGDEYYFIPCYTQGGEGTVYYTEASTMDDYEKQPMEELKTWLELSEEEKAANLISFDDMQFDESENLQQVLQVLNERVYLQESDKKTASNSNNNAQEKDSTSNLN